MAAHRLKMEKYARLLVLCLALGAAITALGFRYWDRSGVIEIHAAAPDKGGWLAPHIRAQVGEPLNLRLISDDFVHSFALGQSDFEPVDIFPGKSTEVTLVFDEPGTYTFYCTRWCGADHWRMRGTITIEGSSPKESGTPTQPRYLQLGIDLDSPRQFPENTISQRPSAVRGAALAKELPLENFAGFLHSEYYQSHSPYETWLKLTAAGFTQELSPDEIWDLAAWIWEQNTDPETLTQGRKLYQRDCAACHGVDGDGSGVYAVEMPAENSLHTTPNMAGHSVQPPTNFQDLKGMLPASPALLQGKIIRGGMGTGMPSWGLIYTEEQTWALTDFLWSFVFDYTAEVK